MKEDKCVVYEKDKMEFILNDIVNFVMRICVFMLGIEKYCCG